MALSAKERKAAERQRKRETGFNDMTFSLPSTTAAQLKALATAYGVSQADILERALADMYSKLSDENVLEGLKGTDEMKPLQVARYLLNVCSGNREKAGKLYLEYLQRKHPGFRISSKDEAYKKIEMHYRAVKSQINNQLWPVEASE